MRVLYPHNVVSKKTWFEESRASSSTLRVDEFSLRVQLTNMPACEAWRETIADRCSAVVDGLRAHRDAIVHIEVDGRSDNPDPWVSAEYLVARCPFCGSREEPSSNSTPTPSGLSRSIIRTPTAHMRCRACLWPSRFEGWRSLSRS